MPAMMNSRIEKYFFMAEPSNTFEMRLPISAPMKVPMVVNAATSRTICPYDRHSWKAYNSKGEEVELEIIG